MPKANGNTREINRNFFFSNSTCNNTTLSLANNRNSPSPLPLLLTTATPPLLLTTATPSPANNRNSPPLSLANNRNSPPPVSLTFALMWFNSRGCSSHSALAAVAKSRSSLRYREKAEGLVGSTLGLSVRRQAGTLGTRGREKGGGVRGGCLDASKPGGVGVAACCCCCRWQRLPSSWRLFPSPPFLLSPSLANNAPTPRLLSSNQRILPPLSVLPAFG